MKPKKREYITEETGSWEQYFYSLSFTCLSLFHPSFDLIYNQASSHPSSSPLSVLSEVAVTRDTFLSIFVKKKIKKRVGPFLSLCSLHYFVHYSTLFTERFTMPFHQNSFAILQSLHGSHITTVGSQRKLYNTGSMDQQHDYFGSHKHRMYTQNIHRTLEYPDERITSH